MPKDNYSPPAELWVEFGDGREILRQWDFEPFPPDQCAEQNIIKYVMAPHGLGPSTPPELLLCPMCMGDGMAESEIGELEECRNCGGDGNYVPRA